MIKSEQEGEMTVHEIILEYLEEHGFDGLCTNECGCSIDDLAPCCCSECVMDCVPARKISVTEAIILGMEFDDYCEWIMVPAVKRRPPMNKLEQEA